MKKILQIGDPVLRKTSKPVTLKDIRSPKFKKHIKDMRSTVNETDDGVAIAAPQIGLTQRVFILADKVLNIEGLENIKNMVYINPVITKQSRKKAELEEGCLSVKNIYGLIKRAEKVTVEAYDEKGQKFTQNAGGFLAQIFQHEIDHLDGTLFVDKAYNLEEVIREENNDEK